MSNTEDNNQTSPTVLTEKIGKVALITLNRPNRLNALSEELVQALIKTISTLSAAKDINVIVMTGNGKAFCAGVDLKNVVNNVSDIFDNNDLMDTFSHCTKPIIGAINGPAMTGGLELALCCDFLYASESAIFGDTHVQVGLMPAWGLSQKLSRIIGINRAREISLSGDIIDAATAMQWGLINKTFSQETLLEQTLKKAQSIAEHTQDSTKNLKKLINEGWGSTLQQGILLESKYSVPHNKTVDLSAMMQILEQVKKRNRKSSS